MVRKDDVEKVACGRTVGIGPDWVEVKDWSDWSDFSVEGWVRWPTCKDEFRSSCPRCGVVGPKDVHRVAGVYTCELMDKRKDRIDSVVEGLD